ncbi:enoyl-CoA hydratase/isomerase family protein [Martelella mediterranea]|uniref:3-hydroxyacyl-CoA dehydrogenase NAD-binding domain-containing protein n=1 Tax=Martelella mediterranea TaxID=293089 RepID=UPI001E297931|nr:3-hydroxyacyl-CoA dehydrogenase NAD-binding domain-containing protein [Martelella mediterranea]MCD1635740.1 enoyl-CoA hydratase/isomerase family protein [Martelella mediterranea]
MNSNTVTLTRDGEVAVLVIDNPPVNALSEHMRVSLKDCLDRAASDEGIRALVLAGEGRTLCAGADIRQFGAPPKGPLSPDIFMQIAAMKKPVVAAIHGPTLGGGFEMALACHARVALPDAEMGLPELKLGLIPGAGGTYRLPRLIGAVPALELIGSSRRLSAAEALELGVIDAIAEDVRAKAAELARALADREQARTASGLGAWADFDAAAKKLLRRARGAMAPATLVKAIGNAFDMEDAEAQRAEQVLFQELRTGPQSAAMRHLFFAERQAGHLGEGVTGNAGPLHRAAVIGAGTMGGGIAMCFADAGLPVTLIDASADGLEAGLARIRRNYGISVSRGRIDAREQERRMALITPATSLSAASGVDIVIEAVFEDMALKRRLFAELDRLLPDHAVLATNTSSLDIDEMAAATNRPFQVVGLHFFSPANVMKLLETVRGAETGGATLATALKLAKRLGKQPAIVGNCPGFVGNRILRQRHHQAELLLEQGASPQDVDRAVTDFGMAMGPFQMNDLAGLDVSALVRKSQGYQLPVADALCAMGRLGQKTGKGYYRYEDGRTPIPDPEVDAVIAGVAERLGVRQRSFSQDEIRERLFYPMVNEGARILEEGIAARSSDIDVIYVHGYGFPAWRGGLMYWADAEGLDRIVAALDGFAQESGESRLEPAPLLRRLAETGQSFADLQSNGKTED